MREDKQLWSTFVKAFGWGSKKGLAPFQTLDHLLIIETDFFIAVANLLSLKDTRLDMQSKVLRAGIAAEEKKIQMQMIYHVDAINLTYGVLLNN